MTMQAKVVRAAVATLRARTARSDDRDTAAICNALEALQEQIDNLYAEVDEPLDRESRVVLEELRSQGIEVSVDVPCTIRWARSKP